MPIHYLYIKTDSMTTVEWMLDFSKVYLITLSEKRKKNWLGNFKELAIGLEIFNTLTIKMRY
jgi:hypothetical protein